MSETSMSDKQGAVGRLLARSPVIPVLTIARLDDAVPLARALSAGGLGVLEVTMRTPVALEAITRIKAALPDVSVGAGTVLTPADLSAALDAGADFLVSPGATRALVAAAAGTACPFLPGSATAGEAMELFAAGYRYQKFFPAEASGGVATLKALAAPLAEIVFCPTGGITAVNAAAYLALPTVACVGASWPAPDQAVRAGSWSEIEERARSAAQLTRAHVYRGPAP